ncbi:MAG: GIY-YIG nuclease family protein [Patescibacteria group bacterium]
MFYYTYVLRGLTDGKLYTGYTNDLKKRIEEFHQKVRVNATKNRLPIQLVYYEACLSKYKALKREKYFKSGFGRRFLKTRI